MSETMQTGEVLPIADLAQDTALARPTSNNSTNQASERPGDVPRIEYYSNGNVKQPAVLDLEWRCDACGAVSATSTERMLENPEMQCFRCGLQACPRDVWSRRVTTSKKADPISLNGMSGAPPEADWEGQRVEAPLGGMLALVTQEQRERLFRSAVIYLFFCVHFLIISTLQRPVAKLFDVHRALEQELVLQAIPGTLGQTFLNVTSWANFWQWTDGVLMAKVYDDPYGNDSGTSKTQAPNSKFTVAKYNRVLSAIRFRQVRVKPTLARCPRNSMGVLPNEFEMACSRKDPFDKQESCDTALDSHTLSRPCWGAWNGEHLESAYPGPFELASSKLTLGPHSPQQNLICPETCHAFFIEGARTSDENPALSIPGVAAFLTNSDRYVSSEMAFAKCKESCDVSGSSHVSGLSPFQGKGDSPDFCSSGACSSDIIDLPLNTTEALRRVAAMKRERWTSESTRGVVVELNVYNPNYDIAALVRVLVDANPGGLLEPHFSVKTCALTMNGSATDTIRFLLEILFACWLLYYFAIEVSEMNYQKWEYWKDTWNYIELANLGSFAYSLAVWWVYLTGHDFDSFRTRDPNAFKDLYAVTLEFNKRSLVASFSICFMCMRFFKFIRLSNEFRMLWSTLAKAVRIICPLLLVYLASIFAFSCSGHWLFGQRVRVFSSLSSAMLYLLLSVKDGIDYAEIKDASPTASFLWYLCWYFISKVIVFGLIIAVLIAVFGEMLHQFQLESRAQLLAEQSGANIPKLRWLFIHEFCPTIFQFLPAMFQSKNSKSQENDMWENHRELRETLREVDLEELWKRGMQGLLDNELALDADELAFLFQDGMAARLGVPPDQSAQLFINRLCSLASLTPTTELKSSIVLDQVLDLETKIEHIGNHIHASRLGLEQRFPKLRPFMSSTQTGAVHVFEEAMQIDDVSYLVEMSIVGKDLQVTALDEEAGRTLDMSVKDKDYQRLLTDAGNDYSVMAQRLRHNPHFPLQLEFGPPPQEALQVLAIRRHRLSNSVFPADEDDDGITHAKPPVRGQLKMASAMLDMQKKGGPFGPCHTSHSLGRPKIQNFLNTQPLQRET